MKTFYSIIILLLSLAATPYAQNLPLRLKHYNISKKVALDQYDPVAYFTENKAVKGNPKFISSYLGITYYFSSAANEALFEKNPSQYEPAYGGWCAYAMGKEARKEDADPRIFKVENGRLFIFYNKWGVNNQPKWEENKTILIEDGDKNWSNLCR